MKRPFYRYNNEYKKSKRYDEYNTNVFGKKYVNHYYQQPFDNERQYYLGFGGIPYNPSVYTDFDKEEKEKQPLGLVIRNTNNDIKLIKPWYRKSKKTKKLVLMQNAPKYVLNKQFLDKATKIIEENYNLDEHIRFVEDEVNNYKDDLKTLREEYDSFKGVKYKSMRKQIKGVNKNLLKLEDKIRGVENKMNEDYVRKADFNLYKDLIAKNIMDVEKHINDKMSDELNNLVGDLKKIDNKIKARTQKDVEVYNRIKSVETKLLENVENNRLENIRIEQFNKEIESLKEFKKNNYLTKEEVNLLIKQIDDKFDNKFNAMEVIKDDVDSKQKIISDLYQTGQRRIANVLDILGKDSGSWDEFIDDPNVSHTVKEVVEDLITMIKDRVDQHDKLWSYIRDDRNIIKDMNKDKKKYDQFMETMSKKVSDLEGSVNRWNKIFKNGSIFDDLEGVIPNIKKYEEDLKKSFKISDTEYDWKRLMALENSITELRRSQNQMYDELNRQRKDIYSDVIDRISGELNMNKNEMYRRINENYYMYTDLMSEMTSQYAFNKRINEFIDVISNEIPEIKNEIMKMDQLNKSEYNNIKNSIYWQMHQMDMDKNAIGNYINEFNYKLNGLYGEVINLINRNDQMDINVRDNLGNLIALRNDIEGLKYMMGSNVDINMVFNTNNITNYIMQVENLEQNIRENNFENTNRIGNVLNNVSRNYNQYVKLLENNVFKTSPVNVEDKREPINIQNAMKSKWLEKGSRSDDNNNNNSGNNNNNSVDVNDIYQNSSSALGRDIANVYREMNAESGEGNNVENNNQLVLYNNGDIVDNVNNNNEVIDSNVGNNQLVDVSNNSGQLINNSDAVDLYDDNDNNRMDEVDNQVMINDNINQYIDQMPNIIDNNGIIVSRNQSSRQQVMRYNQRDNNGMFNNLLSNINPGEGYSYNNNYGNVSRNRRQQVIDIDNNEGRSVTVRNTMDNLVENEGFTTVNVGKVDYSNFDNSRLLHSAYSLYRQENPNDHVKSTTFYKNDNYNETRDLYMQRADEVNKQAIITGEIPVVNRNYDYTTADAQLRMRRTHGDAYRNRLNKQYNNTVYYHQNQ